jgi:hypothetical protein
MEHSECFGYFIVNLWAIACLWAAIDSSQLFKSKPMAERVKK